MIGYLLVSQLFFFSELEKIKLLKLSGHIGLAGEIPIPFGDHLFQYFKRPFNVQVLKGL